MNQNQLKAPTYERLTNIERARIIAREFRGDEDLALSFGCYCRAQLAGRAFAQREPVPECSSTAWEELADGTIRRLACLADYEGLVAVYRICADGRMVRQEAWPQWLVGLDRDPEWRATCRRLQANKKRRQRRTRARMELLVKKLTGGQAPAVLSNDNGRHVNHKTVAA